MFANTHPHLYSVKELTSQTCCIDHQDSGIPAILVYTSSFFSILTVSPCFPLTRAQNNAGDELGNYMSYSYSSCLAAFGEKRGVYCG